MNSAIRPLLAEIRSSINYFRAGSEGAQLEGISLTVDDKLRIAEQLPGHGRGMADVGDHLDAAVGVRHAGVHYKALLYPLEFYSKETLD